MLGLGDNKDATTAQITKAYKKTALKYHPDKVGEDNMTEDLKALWLKVQLAHETLIDDTKRKKYDSSLPFDDSLPSKGDFKNEKEFYEEM